MQAPSITNRGRRTALIAVLMGASIATACGGDDSGDAAPTPSPAVEQVETDVSTDVEASDTAPGAEPTATEEPIDTTTAVDAEPTPAPPAAPTPLPILPVAVPEDLSLQLTTIVNVDTPTAIATRPGSDLLYATLRGGKVVAIEVVPDGGSVVGDVVDIGGSIDSVNGERGLLGLAFSPDGSRLYLNATDTAGNTFVDEYTMSGEVADLASRRTVIGIEQPGENHNGGALAFGPDGYLYIAMGDGSSSPDASANSQDTGDLLGDILRIDPLSAVPYAIPSDNPFTERGGLPEIFLMGVRNPWKISFDRATGDLWIADVGLSSRDEVNVLYSSQGGGLGANLGWPDVEGSIPFAASGPPANHHPAIHEYDQSDGSCSISGGIVYRGAAIPELYGTYVFSDFCTARVMGFASSEAQGPLGAFELGVGMSFGVTFVGEGPDGELYVGGFDNAIARIDPV